MKLCKRVESIIQEVLNIEKLNYYSITSRAKTVESYKLKATKGRFAEPRAEIMDMAGIRIITYTDSDAKHVFGVIENIFDLCPNLSFDKAEELGIDKVGYRSLHCVATLGINRLKLRENRVFKNMYFEIQIRTILQHAWAEFEHDRNYKFRGELPKDIKRRLSLVAGNLESIDREFDSLSKEIDMYSANVEERANKGDLAIPINTLSLNAYINEKFKDLIKDGIVDAKSNWGAHTIFKELSAMNIQNLTELNAIIPKDFIKNVRTYYLRTLERSKQFPEEWNGAVSTYSVISDILMISNPDLYFKKAWKKKWQGIEQEIVSLYEAYGIDFEKYRRRYDLLVV
jgi:ppGpp synthetase/RelA/SpoT-type nucleotidyltranferase